MNMDKIKLIVSEIDGIITEHLTTFDAIGNVPFKQYCMKDFEAINMFKKAGFKFAFVALDNNVNYYLAQKKNIPFFWDPNGNKKQALTKALQRYEITPENLLYIGCSYSDLDLMKMAEYSFCPEDAVPEAKNVADAVLAAFSGTGVLCEAYTLVTKGFRE